MALKIDNVKVPAVQRDSPTRPAPPRVTEGEPPPVARPGGRRAENSRSKKPVSVDQALAEPHRPVTNRVPGVLWDQLVDRATELGIPIRLLLTDAIVQAVELDAEEHGRRVRKTRRREQLAKLPPEE